MLVVYRLDLWMRENNSCCVGTSLQAEWEKLIDQASLNVVAMKKSFYGTVMFLCRKRTSSKQPVFLSVDNMDYKWVETLQV